ARSAEATPGLGHDPAQPTPPGSRGRMRQVVLYQPAEEMWMPRDDVHGLADRRREAMAALSRLHEALARGLEAQHRLPELQARPAGPLQLWVALGVRLLAA